MKGLTDSGTHAAPIEDCADHGPEGVLGALSIEVLEKLARLRVLVAEDNALNQKVARAQLAKFSIDPTCVASGEEAVELLASREFDVVLMDVQMPGIDGLEATRWIRESGTAVAIVGLTAESSSAMSRACIEAGMNVVVTKPIGLAALRDLLLRYTG